MSRTKLQHVVIRASAGTGKTYQLSNCFIRLLAAGVAPEQILATTFTRKAAGEILDRVLFRLANAATDEKAANELATEIGQPKHKAAFFRNLLAQTVRQLHRLRVGTLDSYFLQVAGTFSLELGLPPGWTICEPLVDDNLRNEAVEQVLARQKLADLLALMNLLSKGAAIRSVSRLIDDTVRAIFGLYRQTEPPAWAKIVCKKGLSASDLEAAIEELTGFPLADKRWIAARDGDALNARLENWDDFIDKGFAAKVLCGENVYYGKPLPAELIDIYHRLLKHAESVLVGQIARQTEATHRLLERFGEQYFALQDERRAIRFDDVTHRLALATAINAPERLAFRMDSGIRHLLVDEFQDTSPVQWQVLRPLAQSLTQQDGGSFFCVGDTKQAIYGWRGGVAEIFDALDGELKGLNHQSLTCSYRSAQPVIDVVNQVFTSLTKHPNLDKFEEAVANWQRKFPPHSTTRTDLSGYVRLCLAPPVENEGDDPEERLFESAAELVQQQAKQSPQCSIGVLVRTNDAVARMIYLLRQKDVPASEEGGNPLIDSPAVELILSLLRLADHPGDSVARFHLAQSPLATALELTDHYDGAAAARAARNVRRQLLDDGYGNVVFAWAKRLAECCDRRDLSRLQQLIELAYEYQPQSTLRTADFLSLVEGRRMADPTSSEVRVMTIHQAKGLEFDIVVLPELGGQLCGQPDPFVAGRPGPTQPVDIVCRLANENVRQFFPPELQKLFEDEVHRSVAESLCVLYVAMTRAVHALYMILPQPKANERKLPKTYAGLLRAALASDPPADDRLLFEHGDSEWHENLHPSAAMAPSISGAPAVVRLAPASAVRERGLERASPSSLEGGQRVPVQNLLRPQDRLALDRGTLFHAWLEQIAWLDDGIPNAAALTAMTQSEFPQFAADPKELKKSINQFLNQLQNPQVADVLKRSFYEGKAELQVQRERSFTVRDGDVLLSGSIDRLVKIHSGGKLVAVDVVDFKTDVIDSSDSATLAERVEHYRPQVQAYRRAAANFLKIDGSCVTARLVFLHPGIVQSMG